MKKIINSIIAFVIMATMVFSTLAPITVFALDVEGDLLENEGKVQSVDVPMSERYHIIEKGYREKYDLQEGIFGYQSSKMINKTSVYFYSDGYFEDAPEIYNSSLATMSLTLAMSCFNAERTDFDLNMPKGVYSNIFRHVKLLMSDLGILDKDIYVNESFDIRPTEDTIGMIMGSKQIMIDGEDFILIPIAIRGGDYETEWASNTTLGASGEAEGFSTASYQVLESIEGYVKSNTSFDLSDALKNGKVKFWIVGYSRAAAVANLTAKRLTDTYGETGNSIYAYTFETPNCGMDAYALNKPWTYDGIYANIHNIINPSDIVTFVPPKEMGFKRYGVDHYSPGTEVGEIITSVYETPTGITVTTYADNISYCVGDDAYASLRDEMILHLANIDDKILFSDSFSLATMDITDVAMKGKLFTTLNDRADINAGEWLEAFISDLQKWSANGTYSLGSINGMEYDDDYRKFYTSHVDFSGQKLVSVEEAIQCSMNLAFSYYKDEEFIKALAFRMCSLLLEPLSLVDLLMNVTGKWDRLTEWQQARYCQNIWDCLNDDMEYDDGTAVKKITDFVEDDEKKILKKSLYTLSSFLFLFITQDGNNSPSLDGVIEKRVHIATLIFNIMTIAQGHFPEICFAWLRTSDENYSSDNENAMYSDVLVNWINDENNAPPEIEVNIAVNEGQSTLTLTSIIKTESGVDANSSNNGSAIYYALYENGEMKGDWQLYRAPIVIDTQNETEYTVKAFAARFEERGTEIEITNEQIRFVNDLPDPKPDETQDEIISESPKADEKIVENTTAVIATASALILLSLLISVVLIVKRRQNKKN